MYNCPKCGEETISSFRKLMLGPGRTIRCSNCNSRISVSWWTWIIFVGVLSFTFVLRDILDPGVDFALTVVLLGLDLYIHMKYIPLVVRDRKN